MPQKNKMIFTKTDPYRKMGSVSNEYQINEKMEVIENGKVVGTIIPNDDSLKTINRKNTLPYNSLCLNGGEHSKKIIGNIVLCSKCAKTLGFAVF